MNTGTSIIRAPIRAGLQRQLLRPHPVAAVIKSCNVPSRPRIEPPSLHNAQSPSFSTTPCLLKKSKPKDQHPLSMPDTPNLDPYDFSTLEASIASAQQKCKDDLTKLRVGGRTDPTSFENLRVQIGKSKNSPGREWYKLGDLAQVMIRGRNVNVLIGEKEVCRGACGSVSLALNT